MDTLPDTFVDEYAGMVQSIATAYMPTGYCRDDFTQDLWVAAIEAYRRWEPKTAKQSTYVYECMKRKALEYARKAVC